MPWHGHPPGAVISLRWICRLWPVPDAWTKCLWKLPTAGGAASRSPLVPHLNSSPLVRKSPDSLAGCWVNPNVRQFRGAVQWTDPRNVDSESGVEERLCSEAPESSAGSLGMYQRRQRASDLQQRSIRSDSGACGVFVGAMGSAAAGSVRASGGALVHRDRMRSGICTQAAVTGDATGRTGPLRQWPADCERFYRLASPTSGSPAVRPRPQRGIAAG